MGGCEWALAIRLGKTGTWALTREWAHAIRLGKTGTWTLTREWALARDTTVHVANRGVARGVLWGLEPPPFALTQ